MKKLAVEIHSMIDACHYVLPIISKPKTVFNALTELQKIWDNDPEYEELFNQAREHESDELDFIEADLWEIVNDHCAESFRVMSREIIGGNSWHKGELMQGCYVKTQEGKLNVVGRFNLQYS